MTTLKLKKLLSSYRPGSGDDNWTWGDEAGDLLNREPDYMKQLKDDICKDGIKEPILLGTDKRIWDGHHRIVVAILLDLDDVPVTHPSNL